MGQIIAGFTKQPSLHDLSINRKKVIIATLTKKWSNQCSHNGPFQIARAEPYGPALNKRQRIPTVDHVVQLPLYLH